MIDEGKFYVKISWGPRKETLERCASRAEKCLKELAHCGEVFGGWLANSRPLPVDQAAILERLRENKKHEDFKEDLGYMLFLWNGGSKETSVSLHTTCSSYNHLFVNYSNLDLPGRGEVAERLIRWDVMVQLLAALVRAWEPDFGEVMTAEYFHSELDKQTTTRPELPLVGWMIYLSNARGSLPALPSHYRVVPVEGFGNTVVATEERFSHERQEHLRAAQELSDLLKRAGLLGPIPTVAPLRQPGV